MQGLYFLDGLIVQVSACKKTSCSYLPADGFHASTEPEKRALAYPCGGGYYRVVSLSSLLGATNAKRRDSLDLWQVHKHQTSNTGEASPRATRISRSDSRSLRSPKDNAALEA